MFKEQFFVKSMVKMYMYNILGLCVVKNDLFWIFVCSQEIVIPLDYRDLD